MFFNSNFKIYKYNFEILKDSFSFLQKMSRIVIFGNAKLDMNGFEDPSIKLYLVGNDYDYEDDNIVSITDRNILDFYENENLENLEEPIVFVDCSGFSKNYLDVMYRLRTAKFENRSYISSPSGKTIKLKDIKVQKHFNPFDGDEIPKTYKEKEYLNSFFKNISLIIYYYIRAGFADKEIKEIPPGWTMNLAGKELNAIIRYYGLFPIAPDVALNIELSHNSQYRQIILKTLIAVASNFVVRNKIINIAEIEDWNSMETWNMIQKRF